MNEDHTTIKVQWYALKQDLSKDNKKCDKIRAVGGCFALVHLLKNCLDSKAIDEFSACDQVTELNELAVLVILQKTLVVITDLTFSHNVESRGGTTAIGGVEVIVKIMRTFPKCQALQETARGALVNLTCNNPAGKKKAIESGGIEVVLADVTNHLNTAHACERACKYLVNIAMEGRKIPGY
jgi:hypothetical protein